VNKFNFKLVVLVIFIAFMSSCSDNDINENKYFIKATELNNIDSSVNAAYLLIANISGIKPI